MGGVTLVAKAPKMGCRVPGCSGRAENGRYCYAHQVTSDNDYTNTKSKRALPLVNEQFAIRTRDYKGRGSQFCVRVVGQPASGKSWLAKHLAAELGAPAFSIDAEREKFLRNGGRWVNKEQDLITWVRLEENMDAVPFSIVETSGAHPNDKHLFAQRNTFTIMCRADKNTRRERLKQRQQSGATLATGWAYVEKLIELEEAELEPDIIFYSDRSLVSVSTQLHETKKRIKLFIENDGGSAPVV